MLRHWVRGDALLETFPVRSLTYAEAMAEKLPAALSRQEVAIRDFFDVDHALRVTGLDIAGAELVGILRATLAWAR